MIIYYMNFDNLFFSIKHNTKSKINYTDSNNLYIDKNILLKYDKTTLNIKKLKNKYESFISKLININHTIIGDNFVFKIFNIDYNKSVFIRAYYNDNSNLNYYLLNYNQIKICEIEKCKLKYNSIIQNTVSYEMYLKLSDKTPCEKQIFLCNYYLTFISHFFDILKKNGNVLIHFFSYCDNSTINIIYLLSFIFKEIIIYNGIYIFCKSFLSNSSFISKNDIIKLIENPTFNINPKNDIEHLVKYINNTLKNHIFTNNLIINKKYNQYIDYKIKLIYEYITLNKLKNSKTYGIFIKNIIKNFDRTIIKNKIVEISTNIKIEEGNFINELIHDNKYKKCLEIGMNYGIVSYYILLNNNCTLISIDKEQNKKWDNIGLSLLKDLELIKRHKLILKNNVIALSSFLDKSELFDFIYIDVMNKKYENIFVLFYYSILLLDIGGTIVFDNLHLPEIKNLINYINQNYKFLIQLDSPKNICCYKKITDYNNF